MPILDGIKYLPSWYLVIHTLGYISASICTLAQPGFHWLLFSTDIERAFVTKSAIAGYK